MRLTCPNCDAQYEVPDDVIPASGRDVQCSNCGHTWFEQAMDESALVIEPAPAPEPAPEPAPKPAPAPAPAPVAPPLPDDDDEDEDDIPAVAPRPRNPRRGIDPEIASILQEEADLAAERLRPSKEADPFESQPDLGLEEPAQTERQREAEGLRRIQTLKGEIEAPTGPRRDRLPDIEEINSTLRSTAERPQPVEETIEAVRNRSGFRGGFLGVILIACIAAAVYVLADTVKTAVPALSPQIDSYVVWVDGMRVLLDTTVQGLLGSMDAS